MLQKSINKFKGGYSQDVAEKYVGVDLPFINVTEEPEPIHFYDQSAKRYTDDIIGYRIYVAQKYGDYVQNPISVRINSSIPDDLSFGQKVQFKNLEACVIREKSGFSKTYFRASEIRKVKNEKN